MHEVIVHVLLFFGTPVSHCKIRYLFHNSLLYQDWHTYSSILMLAVDVDRVVLFLSSLLMPHRSLATEVF